ncbi:MAG: histidine phosphatase family protein [Bacteroidota bacterium]|nr:MAG: histidine phosphatase family protein [Bacteroidota bacterium]
MSATRITLIRHGETEWNRAMQLQGHQDSPLTENGIRQAELLAETLKGKSFDALLSSDLERARRTAQIINKHLQLTHSENKSLRERSFGKVESLTLDEIMLKYPEVFQAYLDRNLYFEIPGGESLFQFNQRVIEGIQELAKQFRGKHLLVVAHGGVLDCVIRKIFRFPVDSERCFSVYNTSVNTISVNDDLWKLEEWGNTCHLNHTPVLNEIR